VKLYTSNFASTSQARKWFAILCLMLVVASAAVQALHLHPAGPTNELKDCAICQIATTIAQAAVLILLFLLLWTTAPLVHSEDPEPALFLGSFNLFSRPPPIA
jgi:hypothetical protein